jgi:nitrogen fixation NifU-like protein
VSAELHALYQEVVLDHNRHPRNYRVIERGHQAERHNPICGDRVTVYVDVERDVIRDVGFQASGCAIVKASASLMTESVIGRTRVETHALIERFHSMITAPPGAPTENLGALSVLSGVRQFPIRVRCAILAWEALRAALAG